MKLNDALIMNPERIKRSVWPDWISCTTSNSHVNLEDMLADDWEVIERTVPVSRSLLIELVNKHVAEGFDHCDKFQAMLRELELA